MRAPGRRDPHGAALTKHAAEATVLVLAAAHIGAVCSPVNWRLSAAEIRQVVQDAGARFLMADAEFLPVAQPLGLQVLVSTLHGDAADAPPGLLRWAGDAPPRAACPPTASRTASCCRP